MSVELTSIKNILDRECCPIHNEHPSVSVHQTDISIAACCDTFHEHLCRVMEHMADEQEIGSFAG